MRWEGRLNRALGVLADRGALRVANLVGDGRGPITPRRNSVAYVTWTFDGGKTPPVGDADLRAIAKEFRRTGDELTRDGALYAFEGLLEPDNAGSIGFVRREAYSAEKRPRIVVRGPAPRSR